MATFVKVLKSIAYICMAVTSIVVASDIVSDWAAEHVIDAWTD